MSDTTESIKKTLEDQATRYIGKPFMLSDYSEILDGSKVEAYGTIQRFGSLANVEVTFQKEGFEPCYWEITDDDIPMRSKRVGTIRLGKGVCVTDPCYDRDIWCMTELKDVRPGLWDAYVSIDEIDCWGKRPYILELYHRSLTSGKSAKLEWKPSASLGVDSGQMSVFDDAYYRRKDGSIEAFNADEPYAERFYDECCRLSSNDVGIFYSGDRAVGVVCSSGYGDGVYPLEVQEIDGKIVAMRIAFM